MSLQDAFGNYATLMEMAHRRKIDSLLRRFDELTPEDMLGLISMAEELSIPADTLIRRGEQYMVKRGEREQRVFEVGRRSQEDAERKRVEEELRIANRWYWRVFRALKAIWQGNAGSTGPMGPPGPPGEPGAPNQ